MDAAALFVDLDPNGLMTRDNALVLLVDLRFLVAVRVATTLPAFDACPARIAVGHLIEAMEATTIDDDVDRQQVQVLRNAAVAWLAVSNLKNPN